MHIILDGAKHPFDPEQYSWRHQSKPTSQFITCNIGNHRCFVKRQPNQFSGWKLLVKAIGNSQVRHCPKLLSIAKNHQFYYFAEQLDGDIMERCHSHINGERLINSLFIAIYNINKLGFWYSDFCLKNIFVTNKDNYYLIDVDSSYPHNEKFHHNLDIDFEYSALLVKFGKETGLGTCDLVNGHNGECMNQAMLVAIAVDIRNLFRIPIAQKDSVAQGMLMQLYQKEYLDLFSKLIGGQSDWLATRRLINRIVE